MEQKWEGRSLAKLTNTTADQAWSLVKDFCNVHKIYPTVVETCYKVAGVDGEPGCVRYCAGKDQQHWANEELLSVDPVGRSITYQVTESTMGIEGYVATMKVLPPDSGDDQEGCVLEWSFTSDPIKFWGSNEQFASFLETSLQQDIARKIEEAFKSKD